METKKERIIGIELLRIVSMYLIGMLHVLNLGGVMPAIEQHTIKWVLVQLIFIVANSAVNCYACISGYVGYQSKLTYKRIIYLWLRVVFYTLLITTFWRLMIPESVGVKEWIKALIPTLANQYWYFTSYTLLFILMPILNTALEKVDGKQDLYVTMTLLIVLSVLQTAVTDAFGTNWGMSGLWLLVLYMAGACIRKYNLFSSFQTKKLLLFLGITIISELLINEILSLGLEWGKTVLGSQIATGIVNRTTTNIYPLTVLIAFLMLEIFARIAVPEWTSKWIKRIAPLTFGVYLIQTHPLMIKHAWKDAFSAYVIEYSVLGVLLFLVCVSVSIFAVCLLVEYMRNLLFAQLKVDKNVGRLLDKFISPT